ncbi:hypothetical protein HN51_042099 [Arachis hypogaea]|uniref:Transmembrane protein n=1 Tax=Arachis hypogaea TaxID=3818 RepID=A0A445CWS5_ARAHY|nr:uncharacterized protein DS421_16g567080 [Arachis hypogaea]RYR55368.1 hypothetical protein Ahy_A06g030602 [Arachis hypogaea]
MVKSLEHPWILNALPLLVVILIAAHVFALVYWIYRLATENKPRPIQQQQQQQLQQQLGDIQRRKAH